ncbi:polysaccharide biosynthesis protein [Pedococcus sp. KACC 23699]|uniref:Polysaccharide biosynthesis protein n=1 Tax=Pedococcus sp. KACC 23699 TaxID=3149228 RepID=A0AAU7JQC1_9MICO
MTQLSSRPIQVNIPRRRTRPGLTTLVVGAGEAGRALTRDLARVSSFGLDPIGFLDDDPLKLRTLVARRPVLGTLGDLERVLEETHTEVLVIAIPSLPASVIQSIGARAMACGVSVRHLPPFLSALQRQVAGTDMQSLQVRPLIGRAEMHVVSREAAHDITGRRVLVTGAGGSIGSELCRQIQGFGPASLVMLDHDESNLHRLTLEVSGRGLLDTDETVVADIRDRPRIHQLFREHRPEIVFHAAALKHLPVLERHPCEGVKSNVLGTQNLVEAAVAHRASKLILISTDKAADPSSVLGATKRLAEMVLADRHSPTTSLASVRFGNVLGSRGSLLHVIKQQVASGRPVTVTHPDVTRFFMTVEEAVGLVLEAAHMCERPGTFVLDMGEPVRIVDIVERFAVMLNARDVDIQFTGLRPGEKLHEELFGATEDVDPTAHARIARAKPPTTSSWFRARLEDLYESAEHNRPDEVRAHLRALVPEYTPTVPAHAALAAPYPDDY